MRLFLHFPLLLAFLLLFLLGNGIQCVVPRVLMGRPDENEMVIGKMGSESSQHRGGVDCKEKVTECKEKEEDRVLENEDYIYTNSRP